MSIAVILGNYNDSRFLINWVTKMAPQNPDELIIVDDRSTDNSVAVIQELQKRYRIKLVLNNGPQGCFGAFVKGCQSTDAEYVASWGCDDEPGKNYIHEMRQVVKQYPLVDMFSCNARVMREGREYERILFPFDVYISPDYMVKICKNGMGKMINLIGMVLKRQVLLDMWERGGKDSIADFDAAFAYFMMFSKGLVNLSEKLVTFRSYPNSWGARGKTEEKKKAILIAQELFKINPTVYDRAIESRIWGARYQWAQKVALWGIMKIPSWARRMFYRWFYRYSWKIEKL